MTSTQIGKAKLIRGWSRTALPMFVAVAAGGLLRAPHPPRWGMGSASHVVSSLGRASHSSDTTVIWADIPRHASPPTLVVEATIGAGSSSTDDLLTSINSILPARDGSLWVVDGGFPSGMTVRRFDPRGRPLGDVGKAGQGPGEYSNMAGGLAQLPDGRVLLRDDIARRILVYSEQGQPVDSWRYPARYVGVRGGLDQLVVDSGGFVYMRVTLARPTQAASPNVRPGSVLIRMSASRQSVDTINAPQLPDPSSEDLEIAIRPARGKQVILSAPYNPQPWWRWSPLGYMVTAFSSKYAIDLRIPPAREANRARSEGPTTLPGTWRDGDPVVSIRRKVPAVAVSAEERSDQATYLRELARASGGTSSIAPSDIPATKPAFKEIMIGADGRIWATVSVPSERYKAARIAGPYGQARPTLNWREPTVFDVFEPRGQYIGRVPIPGNARLLASRGDLIWLVEHDGDDVPTIKRVRMIWP